MHGTLGRSSGITEPGRGGLDCTDSAIRSMAVTRLPCTASCLGSTIVGAEATPLTTYFPGLLLGQGALLLLVTAWSKGLIERLGVQGQRLGAGIWIGIGLAFSWVALVD